MLLALVCAVVSPGLVGSAEAAGSCTTASGSTTCTFDYTGAEQTWTVPDGVTQVTLDVFGAQGGNEAADGGNGGRATATITVTPGETLTIVVGGQGHSPFSGGDALGGFNGGGNGGAPNGLPTAYYGSGGGGASDVRISGTDLVHRVIVAGGGGGAADVFGPDGSGFGGVGGGLTGGTGNSAYLPYASSGGVGGNQDGTSGSGQLGTGSNGINSTSNVFNGVGAGGGGGGYYGGAGGSPGTGGGGGSGFGPAGTVFESGVRSGDGQVLLTYTPPDSTPPTTTIALSPTSPDGSNGWYVHQPTVTVGAVDNGGGSGVAETRCVLDPSSVPSTFDALPSTPCPYLGAGVAVTDGVHTVYAASIDDAGNAESPVQSFSFQVDTSPPTTTASATNADSTTYTFGDWTNQSVQVTLSATDTGSGVAHTYYTVDSSDPQTYSTAFTMSAEGDHTVTFWSVDTASNEETAHQIVHVVIDTTAPVVTYSGNHGTYTVDQTINISCTATDALSGVASNTCQNITGPAASFPLGSNSYSASATDNAGNVGTGTTSFTVSVTPVSLCNLTGQYVGNQRATNQLCVPLNLLRLADATHNSRLKTSLINNYILLVNIQRNLSASEKAMLTQLARAL